jgi:glycosyltransferase involved in cell wall biosynthesis
MARITIHTATYNRGYILGKAYESLKNQTCKDFEWIITDDGSTDETSELVKKWLTEGTGFDIIYNPLPHVGIPRALNSGVSKARTDWFMMLDSDDSLLPETVSKVIAWLEEIERLPQDMKIGGVGFCRCFPNGDYMKPQKPLIDPVIGYVDATHIERYKYNLNMDCCEVHRTELMKKYPFKYWGSERYAPEQLCFYSIAMDGWKLRWRDEKLYICDYLPDGQTKDNKLVMNNPMGFAMMYNQNMLIKPGMKNHWRDAVQMTALSFYSGNLRYLRESNDMLTTILSLPFGVLLGLRRKHQFKNLSKV